MENGADHVWLKDAIVFLFAAGLVVPLLRRARVAPVLGFLLAGVALGPFGAGALAETWPVIGIVSIADPEAATPFAELGVLFLLFLLGLELSFDRLWALRRAVFGAGGLQVAVSAAAIAVGCVWIGLAAPAAIAVGLALALSSTAIVMQVLNDERRAAKPVGRAALAVLLFQDVMVAPILILVGFLGRETDTGLVWTLLDALFRGVLAVGLIFLIGRYLLRPAFRLAAGAGGRDFLMAITLLTVIGGAMITAGAGLSLPLGAFLAGLLLGETEFKHQTDVDLEPFKGLLLGLFFMTVGMSLDLAAVWDNVWIVLFGLLVLLPVKGAIAYAACRLFAGDRALSIETAFLLASAGEFAFVVVRAATGAGVFDGPTGTIVSAIVGLSMLCAPLLGRAGRLAASRYAEKAPDAPPPDFSGLSGHVVIAGFGRVGRTIARILNTEEAEIVALERSQDAVTAASKGGWRIWLGDASRPEILEKAGAEGASLFIVTVDNSDDAERMVKAIRAVRRDAPVLARARDSDHARRLAEAGATWVIPDAIEAGLQLAGRALEEYGYAAETIRDRITVERDEEYRREVQVTRDG
ncbi:MAG: cation:proton antiporter [Rhizobiaceae bacterium]|nr:cation:proton antiporter [Rhizobiaceae bacterium]MCV0406597.1 cation:proton antiporter [Rhizobiaceae bacterium]